MRHRSEKKNTIHGSLPLFDALGDANGLAANGLAAASFLNNEFRPVAGATGAAIIVVGNSDDRPEVPVEAANVVVDGAAAADADADADAPPSKENDNPVAGAATPVGAPTPAGAATPVEAPAGAAAPLPGNTNV